MTKRFRFDETSQRVHDYRHLLARWRRVARDAKLKLEPFAQAGEYPVYCLQTRDRSEGGLFVSAGIHGDEPAASEGLLVWAETHLGALVRLKQPLPMLTLPCLNPWGLVNNRRSDERGRDLNRLFDKNNVSPIKELKKLLRGRHFDLGLTLHEDYDARGTYLYEVHDGLANCGAELLARCSAVLPVDPRRRIDDFPFKDGVVSRRIRPERIPLHPEALYLFPRHAPRVLTFETPSEFALARRVQAHVLLIEECVRRLRSTAARRPT